jgi:hypothetical protein
MTEQQDQPNSMRDEVLARINARREAALQTALVRAAANGLVLRGNVTPWMQARLSSEQITAAEGLAQQHHEIADHILQEDSNQESEEVAA